MNADTGNWHREISVAADSDEFLELAGLISDALARMPQVQLPTDLEESAFNNGLNGFDPEIAAFGIR
ncbi:hypothetical protein [Nocardia sp. bgisy118]|uniref:hypothetical protein n=1 Tax=Nocardia sp. bgisy118 TaxID=3413786 RepID=UPI003F49F5BF